MVFFIFLLCLVILAELFDALPTLRQFEGVWYDNLDNVRVEEQEDNEVCELAGVVTIVVEDAQEVDAKVREKQ